MDRYVVVWITAVAFTVVVPRVSGDVAGGCLTKMTIDVNKACVNYTFNTEEYDEFKIKLDEEKAANHILEEHWDDLIIEEGQRGVLSDEEYKAIWVFTSYHEIYDDYVDQLLESGSVTEDGFKYKALHYFLSSAYEKWSNAWGSHQRVIHYGVELSKAEEVKQCEVNDTTNFAGFGLGFRSLDDAEKRASHGGTGGTVFSIATRMNVDVSKFPTDARHPDILVSPCETFKVFATLDRQNHKNGPTFNVVKMESEAETGSGNRMTSLGVITMLAVVCTSFLFEV